MSNWELSKKPASMQANTWEIFIIRLSQSFVLLDKNLYRCSSSSVVKLKISWNIVKIHKGSEN